MVVQAALQNHKQLVKDQQGDGTLAADQLHPHPLASLQGE